MTASPNDIAIVGMSAIYAKAPNLETYWQNILNKVDGIQEAPDQWARRYVDPDSPFSNRIYNRKGGFLLDLAEFDPMEFGIMPNSVDGAEPEQFLALKQAHAALADAGYIDRPFNREKTGIIIGRGVYLNRGNMNYMQHGLVIDQTLDLLQQICPDLPQSTWEQIHEGIRKSLPPFEAQTIPGLVPNVMTGRIANRLDLMGPNYIVDGACASSLIAVDLARQELLSGRCDMVVAGGVNVNITPQCCMMFCAIGALSRDQIHPFGKDADGTIMGEGIGMLILKRLADAERDNDRIYAVLKGVGTSSDGKSVGLLSPRLEGEVLALERAYKEAQVSPETVGLIEAHGTSIPMGDQKEIEALSHLFGDRAGDLPTCAIGTVKSMIGHCLPGSGMAGLIKTALALYHKLLPPTLCEEVNPELGFEKTPFYVNSETRPWIHGNSDTPRRAGVNAFGFGGINAHAILEEYPQERCLRHEQSSTRQSPHVAREWPIELFVIAAKTRSGVLEQVNRLQGMLQQSPNLKGVDLAYTLSQQPLAGQCRLAVLAKDTKELQSKLKTVTEKLPELQRSQWQTRSGIYYGEDTKAGKVAFLFSGEGGQYPNLLADLCLHFPIVRQWFDLMDNVFAKDRDYPPSAIAFPPPTTLSPETQDSLKAKLHQQNVASELNFVAARALYDLLGEFEIKPDLLLGHSVGETIALGLSGILPVGQNGSKLAGVMGQLNQIYKQIETEISSLEGTLFTVGGVEEPTRQKLIETSPFPVYLAMDNCPNQVVLFSKTPKDSTEADQLIDHFKQAGGICARLPYSRANHTPFNMAVREALASFYASLEVKPASIPQYSCVTCAPFPDDPEQIRTLAADHWVSRVRFRETIGKLYEEGVDTFIEVGPKGTLTGFVADILKGKQHLALATDNHRRSGLEQIQTLLGRLFVQQVPFKFDPLYELRQPRLLDFEQLTIKESQSLAHPISLDLPMIELEPDLIATVKKQLRESMGQGTIPTSVNADFPLLGEILEQTATRVRTRRYFQIQEDIFLEDHSLGGSVAFLDRGLLPLPVIPFTFSMEMIAEAGVYLVGEQFGAVSFHHLRAHRWLTLDQGDIELELEAERQRSSDPTTCDVQVRLFQILPTSNHPLLVFEGTVRLAETYPLSPEPLMLPDETSYQSMWNPENLYKAGMFHGSRLQGVTQIYHWGEQSVAAELQVLSTEPFFRQISHPRFQIDAGLLDSVGQLVWYWVADVIGRCTFMVFPYSVEAIYLYAPPASPGSKIFTQGTLQFTGDKYTESSFDLIDETGQIAVRLEQWRDRYFEIPTNFYECGVDPKIAYISSPWLQEESGLLLRRVWPFPEGFFESSYGIWGRILAHLTLSGAEREIWHRFPAQDSKRIPWLLGQIAAKDIVRQWAAETLNLQVAPAEIEIQIAETGQPYAVCPELAAIAEIPEIAWSIGDPHAVATLAVPGYATGVHLQPFANWEPACFPGWTSQEWQWLVAAGYDPNAPETIISFWSAKVAASRALSSLGTTPEQWQLVDYVPDEQLATLIWNDYSCSVQIWFNNEEEILAICHYPY